MKTYPIWKAGGEGGVTRALTKKKWPQVVYKFPVPPCQNGEEIWYEKMSHPVRSSPNLFLHNLIQSRCLAHIINLATQVLIQTWSKSKYYNPHDEDEDIADMHGPHRNEVGLVRLICVKVCGT